MSEHLSWAQWWARPWRSAHDDWRTLGDPVFNALCLIDAPVNCTVEGITPGLPPAPHPTLLKLALASVSELDFVLDLIDSICRPQTTTALQEDHHLWCKRIAKALPPQTLLPADDPLQLLRAWVEPPVWQRLRLRFCFARVLELERSHRPYVGDASRLDTLWQAVVWRMTTRASTRLVPAPHAMDN